MKILYSIIAIIVLLSLLILSIQMRSNMLSKKERNCSLISFTPNFFIAVPPLKIVFSFYYNNMAFLKIKNVP